MTTAIRRNSRSTDPPWRDSAFWILTLVVLALYLGRLAVELALHLTPRSLALECSLLTLFIVPAVIAGLIFGAAGGAIVAGEIAVLSIPDLATAATHHHWGLAALTLGQVILVDLVAVLIGRRTTNERKSRLDAEALHQADLRAEALYRDLFDSNLSPILIVDQTGNVSEWNATARHLFGGDHLGNTSQGGVPLVNLVGPELAGQALSLLLSTEKSPDDQPDGPDEARLVTFEQGGQRMQFRPALARVDRAAGRGGVQVILEDVTLEARRQDQLEEYATQVVLGQENERRHLAQELHDGPLQTLILLCREIDALHEQAPEAIGLGELRKTVESSVTELRSIAKGLRPSNLDDLGLVASIRQLVEESAGRDGFRATFGSTGDEQRLAPAAELALFRVAQEALSNIGRHARASSVAVGLNFERSGIRLLVKDDGIGIEDSHRAGQGGSLGMTGMQERTGLVGGRLVVHSAPGSGTTIDAWLPLEPSSGEPG